MLERLYPDIYVSSIADIPLGELKKRGIKALAFDIDNTIAPYDVAEPDGWALETLKKIMDEGFKICLLSNNKEKRVRMFNRKIGAYAFWRSGKPGTKGLKKAMRAMGCTARETAVVGDQVFTDVWCGHRAGALSVMTAPICGRDQFITKIKRPLEKIVMMMYFRRRGVNVR